MSDHLSHAMLVDYWSDDLSPDVLEQAEAHLMGCDACTLLSARVAALTESFRGLIPPVLSTDALAQLQARGLRVSENPMLPGERREVPFPRDADILLHRLALTAPGATALDATRIDFVLRAESTGEVLLTVDAAPFDRDHGEVLVACQKHYASWPHDTVAEVRVHSAGGAERVTTYTILHLYNA